MLLSDLLELPVLTAAGERIGYVNDVRFVLDGPPEGVLARPQLHGLVVSPRRRGSFLGYERRAVAAPALINRFLTWRHAGSVLVLWPEVRLVAPDAVHLAAGYHPYDPVL
ncbi:PRC-barrel domain-containing protein [Georgenia thermotolerans]|uniref:PRC-barrel domain containing protein n=1 Tax=Georgenia thermotolerans TaxID=527326 RepID=A0A7J5UR64_9MICO|nr:PRC-barrel domain-containing protein [Georgenia thermotolerans]KAE8764614.1 PRC-barrel domain containing protein [Georgenia thermotolerans]